MYGYEKERPIRPRCNAGTDVAVIGHSTTGNKVFDIWPLMWEWSTQSTVLPVPTRHRRHVCIKMRTALPANTKTRPNVVLMLVQRRWRWANIETALGHMLAFAGLHIGVCLHPPLRHHNILASRSGYF